MFLIRKSSLLVAVYQKAGNFLRSTCTSRFLSEHFRYRRGASKLCALNVGMMPVCLARRAWHSWIEINEPSTRDSLLLAWDCRGNHRSGNHATGKDWSGREFHKIREVDRL